jgi:hypothetical protein
MTKKDKVQSLLLVERDAPLTPERKHLAAFLLTKLADAGGTPADYCDRLAEAARALKRRLENLQ